MYYFIIRVYIKNNVCILLETWPNLICHCPGVQVRIQEKKNIKRKRPVGQTWTKGLQKEELEWPEAGKEEEGGE